METMAEQGDARETSGKRGRRMSSRQVVTRVRAIVAQVIWLICLLAAIVLAVGALLVVLKANADNSLVKAVLNLADRVDLGVFDRRNGIKQFHGHDALIKNALFNWGIGAVVWLVAGRLLERIIRPT